MAEPTRLILRIAYVGDGFAGWQRQPDRTTVQSVVEEALGRLFRQPVRITGAGRTDAGVHAAGQVAHFDPPLRIPPHGVVAAVNGMLPASVRVLACRRAPAGFHARRSAVAKVYRYRLAWGSPLPPWEAQRTWLLPARPDLRAMQTALAFAVGTRDFAGLALSGHSGTGARGTVRTVHDIRLAGRGRRASLTVTGDGFLRGMVRRLAGAAVEVGRGACAADWLDALLRRPATRPPAPTAPAHGLTLERVTYPARGAKTRS